MEKNNEAANPFGIMSVLGGRVTTSVAMLPQALRANRPTRAEANIAADVIEQLYAEVCATRRTGSAMPQTPDAGLSPSTRTLLEKVHQRLCRAQIFDLSSEVRQVLEAPAAPAAVSASGLPATQEPKYTVDGMSVVNRASGQPIPADEPVFILRARDTFAAGAIYNYALDCPPGAHRAAVLRRFDDFASFAKQHSARMRAPDTEAEAV